jgi:hypothetical protein
MKINLPLIIFITTFFMTDLSRVHASDSTSANDEIKISSITEQYPDGPRTTTTYKKEGNTILKVRTFAKKYSTKAYDFIYKDECYASYFVGPHSRTKEICNPRLDHIRSILEIASKKSKIADCTVAYLKKRLGYLPTQFVFVDSHGSGYDDRAYFTRYDDAKNWWSLVEAYSIAPDGTVTPATKKMLDTWSNEYEAWEKHQ